MAAVKASGRWSSCHHAEQARPRHCRWCTRVGGGTRQRSGVHHWIHVYHADTGELAPGTAAEETRRTLEAIDSVLGAAGSSLSKVVKAHVFLADIGRDSDEMNEFYRQFFEAPYPARRTVQSKLIQELKVEIEVIAMVLAFASVTISPPGSA